VLTNHRLLVAYDGRAFLGWQRHGGRRTVQGTLEDAIMTAFSVASPVLGASRTDRGAHATGQVAGAALPARHEPETMLPELDRALPGDVRVLAMTPVAADFHPRRDAIRKRYRYVIWNGSPCPDEERGRVWEVRRRLDVAAMRRAAAVFLGTHDFSSFATRSNFVPRSTVRTVTRLELATDATAPSRVSLVIEADAFLYKMVRNVVRALAKAGEGRCTPDDLGAMLRARDRQAAPGSAPASGLYLDAVYYDDAAPAGQPAPSILRRPEPS
jgi:tRNA pseudouridine38-40 synthase